MGIQVNAQLEDSEYLNAVQKYTFSKTARLIRSAQIVKVIIYILSVDFL